MKVETQTLLTIKNYAKKWDITTSYVYKLIKDESLIPVLIDGVKFIDTAKFSVSPKLR